MPEHAGELLRERVLRNAVVVVQSRLSRPADVERGMHMCFRPVHYFANLLPVVDLLKRKVLHRSAGDYEPVKVHVLYLVEGLVEVQQVLM